MTAGDTDGSRQIVFVGDPMCSWCWGFAPVIDTIADEYGDRAPVRVVVGGLRVGTQHPMRDKDKAYVRHHWE